MYVAPDSNDIPADSMSKCKQVELRRSGHLVGLSYNPDVSGWLGRCRNVSQPENVRLFLGDLTDVLENGWQGGEMIENKKVACDFIVENVTARLSIACAVHESWDDVRKHVIGQFLSELVDALEKAKWDVDRHWPGDKPLDKGNALQMRRPSWNADWFLRLYAGTWGPNNVRLAFCGMEPDNPAFLKYQDGMRRHNPKGYPEPQLGSPWQIHPGDLLAETWEFTNWNSPKAIREMGLNTESFVQSIIRQLEACGDAIQDIGH